MTSHGTPAVRAPELRVAQWIDAQGKPRAPLTLAELGDGFKVIYCFQHWCAGCHSHGFPALVKLVHALSGTDFGSGYGFAVVQTVFEGAEANTFERLRETHDEDRKPVQLRRHRKPHDAVFREAARASIAVCRKAQLGDVACAAEIDRAIVTHPPQHIAEWATIAPAEHVRTDVDVKALLVVARAGAADTPVFLD